MALLYETLDERIRSGVRCGSFAGREPGTECEGHEEGGLNKGKETEGLNREGKSFPSVSMM